MFNDTDDNITANDFEEGRNYRLELSELMQDVRERVYPEAKK